MSGSVHLIVSSMAYGRRRKKCRMRGGTQCVNMLSINVCHTYSLDRPFYVSALKGPPLRHSYIPVVSLPNCPDRSGRKPPSLVQSVIEYAHMLPQLPPATSLPSSINVTNTWTKKSKNMSLTPTFFWSFISAKERGEVTPRNEGLERAGGEKSFLPINSALREQE